MPYIIICALLATACYIAAFNSATETVNNARPVTRQDMDYPTQSVRADSIMQVHPTYSEDD